MSSGTLDSLLVFAARASLMGLCLVAILLSSYGDVWWPVTIGLYAPRWPWLVPIFALLPVVLWRVRFEAVTLAAAALIGLLGVLHLNLPMGNAGTGGSGSPRLRIVSYNIGGVTATTPAVLDLLGQIQPDVIALQECRVIITRARLALKTLGWRVHVQPGSCLLSRLEVSRVVEHDASDLRSRGGNGVGVRYDLQGNDFSFSLVNVHPETVRSGIEAVLAHGVGGATALRDITALRDLESSRLAAFVKQVSGPVLVTGDFNMPVQSAIYRRHWARFLNAYSTAGWGLGGTKVTTWHALRIDHVLAGDGWNIHSASVGPHLGGDHRPVVAEVSWTGGRRAGDRARPTTAEVEGVGGFPLR